MAPLQLVTGKADGATGREWLQQVYSQHAGSVLARCRYLLKDTAAAEDAMHEVFAKALTSRAGFRADASVLTWLISIATNHCLNVIRSEKAEWKTKYAQVEAVRETGSDDVERAEARNFVRQALMKFDLETQRAVIHAWVDEMTLDEIAALLKRSVPTIRKRLQQFARVTGRQLATLGEEP